METEYFTNDDSIFWGDSFADSTRRTGPCAISNDGAVFFAAQYPSPNVNRAHGPAFISRDGDLRYSYNNMTHRDNGPAIIYKSKLEYWLNDKQVSEMEFFMLRGVTSGTTCSN